MEIEITQKKKLKRANGSIRDGKIKITIPQWWPKQSKHAAIKSLAEKLEKHHQKQTLLIDAMTTESEKITLTTKKDL